MINHKCLQGVITPVVTPYNNEGHVDLVALDRLIASLLSSGIHGICPCGTTGEYFALSFDERLSILESVATTVHGRANLFAGTNATTTAEVIELSGIARDLGYAAVLLGAPPISNPSRSELIDHFITVAREVDIPIVLYNNPPRTGVDLDPVFLRELLRQQKMSGSNTPQFLGIKESSGSIDRLHELLIDFSNDLEIVCGSDSQALEFFLWGSRSWIAGPSNFLASECVTLYEHCMQRSDLNMGRAIMERLLPLLRTMDDGGKFLQQCKYGCELVGLPVGVTRLPLASLTDLEKLQFRTVYDNTRLR